MHAKSITLLALSAALALTACQKKPDDFDDDFPVKQEKPASAKSKTFAAKPANAEAAPVAPAPATTAAPASAEAKPYTPPAAASDRIATPVPGLQFRLVHRDLVPSDSVPEHKVVLLSEDAANPAVEYEVLRPSFGPALYVKVAPEAGENIIARIRMDTDGLHYRTIYILSEDGTQKFAKITGKIADANNAKNNGAGKLAFVLDGKPIIVSALQQDEKTKKWLPMSPTGFALDASGFTEARDREAAFNARNVK